MPSAMEARGCMDFASWITDANYVTIGNQNRLNYNLGKIKVLGWLSLQISENEEGNADHCLLTQAIYNDSSGVL
jgi:hypothetical protein